MSGNTCGCKSCSGRDCPEESGIEERAHIIAHAISRWGLLAIVADSVIEANADEIMRLATRLATSEREERE